MKVINSTYQVIFKLSRIGIVWIGLFMLPDIAWAQNQDTTRVTRDTVNQNLPYKPTPRPTFHPTDRYGDPFSSTPYESPLFRTDQTKFDVEIDTALNYTVQEKIGDLNYRPAASISFEEFKRYKDRQMLKEYWQSRSLATGGENAT